MTGVQTCALPILPKQNTEKVLESYIGHYPIRDIGIEEEEIGSVVERIYKGV